MSVYAMEKAVALLKRHEGFRKFPYECTEGKLTIGYGFNLDDVGLEETESHIILEGRVLDLHGSLAVTYPYYSDLDGDRQAVLIDMAYNMGLAGLSKFKKMHAALEAKAYNTAAVEMLDSKWADQVGRRANTLALIMEKGSISSEG
jgi:lysozyme